MRCLAILALCVVAALAFPQAPVFELDLNKAPEDRWNGSVQTILRLHEWKYGFGPLFDHYNKSIYSHLNMSMRQMLMKAAMTKTPIYYRELQGMARVFASVGHPEVDIAFLAFNVYYHELAHADDLPHHMHSSNKKRIFRGECTGIVVLPESPALPMLHGRNLDQAVTPAKNITLQLRVVRRNGTTAELLYEAVDFYWFTAGFVTAWKYGSMTLSADWRYPPQGKRMLLDEILRHIATDPNVVSQDYAMRDVLENGYSYANATAYFTRIQMAAPWYVITSTYRVGSVLSVSVDKQTTFGDVIGDPMAVAQLRRTVPELKMRYDVNKWFLVETNYERDEPDPVEDNRRTVAESALTEMGRSYSATPLGVFLTLDEFPVHNEGTFYSVLMGVLTRDVRGFVRQSIVPAEQ